MKLTENEQFFIVELADALLQDHPFYHSFPPENPIYRDPESEGSFLTYGHVAKLQELADRITDEWLKDLNPYEKALRERTKKRI